MSAVSQSDELRREIFLALVETQDRGVGVVKSREEVAAKYLLNPKQIEGIEKEGLTKQWPPLADE